MASPRHITTSLLAAAYLVIQTQAHGGKHQSIQGIEYPTLEACNEALRKMRVVTRPEGGLSAVPYCTVNWPSWWTK